MYSRHQYLIWKQINYFQLIPSLYRLLFISRATKSEVDAEVFQVHHSYSRSRLEEQINDAQLSLQDFTFLQNCQFQRYATPKSVKPETGFPPESDNFPAIGNKCRHVKIQTDYVVRGALKLSHLQSSPTPSLAGFKRVYF